MYSVPNARNEREIRNPNVLIYQLVGVSYELIYHSRLFNIIYIMRTKVDVGEIWRSSLNFLGGVSWLVLVL
ncbi:Uncharacterised protein [Escherichia coli]|uniref:Uncharacterized protein n=1 Tax=Escherichia coli TaxID=562 RepID=A0A2Y8JXU1_ECOLX|nr:Uncharacterised protein [Escherichia coli]SRY46034.1 Uncharacterised protein [Escherichia coli]